jgi:wyosine [tRNA(Phe)-imidazoG37] synthetase (radical SAM superfamily)
MCPQDVRTGGRHKDFLKKMSLQEFEDNVADCAQYGLRVVNLDGSGEATLNRNLPKYIEIVKKYGAKAFIFSNGYRMEGKFMHDCVDAGLDFYRFSWIGYDVEAYDKWMYNRIAGNFGNTWDKVKAMRDYVKETNSECVVSTYHLITDNDNLDYELEHYKRIVEELDVKTEIWKMHNWSGVTDISDTGVRKGAVKTCGRPFSPDVVIRAGGLGGARGAVHPCCQVLGRDEEAVLGHTSEQDIRSIFFGSEYSTLRDQHTSGDYPDFCKSCDFLIDDPEVLVYTNHERDLMKMHGTEFNLRDYQNET